MQKLHKLAPIEPISSAANSRGGKGMANDYSPYESYRRARPELRLVRAQEPHFVEWQTEEIPMPEAKSYLLSTVDGTIRTVMLPAGNRIEHIRKLVGSSGIDVVRIADSHLLYADNNGLIDGLSSIADLKGHPSPLAGNLLIVGKDESGKTASVSAGIDDVASWFTIIRPVFLPVFETVRESQMLSTRVIRLDIRIERSIPNIIE
ncbi:DUF3846 domain-containing protein [Rhizobium multihospitium]|nr:hypothetical protein [Rhizobium multihospitium]